MNITGTLINYYFHCQTQWYLNVDEKFGKVGITVSNRQYSRSSTPWCDGGM